MKLGKFLGFLVSQKGIKANPEKGRYSEPSWKSCSAEQVHLEGIIHMPSVF